MKIYQILFILLFGHIIFSMEKENNYPVQIKHSVPFPQYIACLQNNHLVIAGTGGIDIIDLITKQSVSQKYNLERDRLEIIHDITTNKEKSQVAIISTTYIRHYDIKNNRANIEDQLGDIKKKYTAFTYDNNFIVYKPHQKIIYLNGIPTSIEDHIKIARLEKPIACHPTKNLILYPSSHSQYNSLYEETGICYSTNFIINVSEPSDIIGVEFNHDGSLIIINELNNGCFLLTTQPESFNIRFNTKKKSENSVQYPSMAIDSHNTLALLSWDNTVQFWNCLTEELLDIISLNPIPNDRLPLQSALTKRLSFSYDETKIYCCLRKNCYELYTPKGKFLLFILFFLKNYKKLTLPQDIIYLITKNVLDYYHSE